MWGRMLVLAPRSGSLLIGGKVSRRRVTRRLTYFRGNFPFLGLSTTTSIRGKVVTPTRGRVGGCLRT